MGLDGPHLVKATIAEFPLSRASRRVKKEVWARPRRLRCAKRKMKRKREKGEKERHRNGVKMTYKTRCVIGLHPVGGLSGIS